MDYDCPSNFDASTKIVELRREPRGGHYVSFCKFRPPRHNDFFLPKIGYPGNRFLCCRLAKAPFPIAV